MLTNTRVEFQTVDLVKPIEDLNSIQELLNKLINYKSGDVMSLGDVAKLTALLPDGLRELGIESQLTYEASKANLALATEALTTNAKVGIGALISAAIAAVVALYRWLKNRNFKSAGPNNQHPVGMVAAKAYRKEATKTAPVLKAQIELFRDNMKYFREVGVSVLDGAVHPKLLRDCISLEWAIKPYMNLGRPSTIREKDKTVVPYFLDELVELMVPGRFYYHDFIPYNFMFMSDEEWFPHTEYLEKFFRFVRREKFLEKMLPDVIDALDYVRYRPHQVADHTGPDAGGQIGLAYDAFEKLIDIEGLAKAVGDPDDGETPIFRFIDIVDMLQRHVQALFGRDIYAAHDGLRKPSPIVAKGLQDYYYFMTAEVDNEVGYTWYNMEAMADQCLDLLQASEKYVTSSGRNILAEMRHYFDVVMHRYKKDMAEAPHLETPPDTSRMDHDYANRIEQLKNIGDVLRAIVRLLTMFGNIVGYMTNFEDRLKKMMVDQEKLTKAFIGVNERLGEIRNG